MIQVWGEGLCCNSKSCLMYGGLGFVIKEGLLVMSPLYYSLGPFNTRLVKAYCEFDSRVPELITAVKIWTRSKGIQRTLLNSYALSLMVIYSLQRCSPPVLPCLQDPGAWPRNMQWCGETVENEVDQQITVPWNTSFTTPGSLLPSTNTESIGNQSIILYTSNMLWDEKKSPITTLMVHYTLTLDVKY